MWKIPGKENESNFDKAGSKGKGPVKAQKGKTKPNFNRRSGGG